MKTVYGHKWFVREETATPTEQAKAAKESAKQRMDDALRRLGSSTKPTSGLDPDKIIAAVDFFLAAKDYGIAQFKLWIAKAKEVMGEARVRELAPYLEEAWNQEGSTPAGKVADVLDELAKEEAATKKAPVAPPEEEQPTTGTKHAKTDELRAKRGMPERQPPIPETFEDWEAEAARRIKQDPSYPGRLARRLINSEEAPDKIENAALGQHIQDLENKINAGDTSATTFFDLATAVDAASRGGSEAGRALVSRKAIRYADFSLAGLVQQHIDEVGEHPSKKKMEEYAELARKLKESEADREALAKRVAEQDIELAIKRAGESTRKAGEPPKRGTKRERLQRNAKESVALFKAAWADAVKAGASPTATTGALNPEALAALGKAAKAAAGVVKAYTELGVNSFLELMGRVRKDIGEVTKDQKDLFLQEWDKLRGSELPPIGDVTDRQAIGRRAKQLLRAAVEAGITDREEVIDAVHEQLLLEGVQQERWDTMQAMSSYGEWTPLPEGDVEDRIRAIKGEVRQLMKRRDLLNAIDVANKLLAEGMSPEMVAIELRQQNLLPKATGREMATPEDVERELISEVNKLKKQIPVSAEERSGQLKTALSTAKTAAENQLKSLDTEISALEQAIQDRKRLEKTKDRVPLQPDTRLTELRGQLADKRQRRNDLKEAYNKIFPPTKEQRILTAQQQERAALKQLARLEQQLKDIKSGKETQQTRQQSLVSQQLQDQIKQARQRVAAAKKAAKEAELGQWEGEGGAGKNTGKKELTDEKRLQILERALDREIAALTGDAKVGRLERPRTQKEPVTSEAVEAKRAQIRTLKEARDKARELSPEWQAKEEAKLIARTLQTKQKSLEFWTKTRDEAKQGILPKPKKRKTPETEELRAKEMEIDAMKRDALYQIELEKRRRWNLGQKIGAGVVEVASLLPRTLMAGMEMSVFRRQGWFYFGHPRLAFANLVRSMQSVFSERMAFSQNEDLSRRANARNGEYKQAGLDFTQESGPLNKTEELYQSFIVNWLAKTENVFWFPARFAAKSYMGFERGFRNFSNGMKADFYDSFRRDTMAIRDFFNRHGIEQSTEWTEQDAKTVGRTSNILSGRGTGLKGSPWTNFLLWAPRWVWSRIQAEFILPFQMATPQFIGQWNADASMRIAHAKLYAQALTTNAAYMAAIYWIMMLMRDDDDEKPTVEWNLTSSDLWKVKVGDTRIDTMGGMQQPLVFASRIVSGVKKNLKGEVQPLRGEDARPGQGTAWDVITQQVRFKSGPLFSGLVDFFDQKTAVGEELPDNPFKRAAVIAGSRMTPMSYGDMWEAEKSLGLARGTVAAIEAFFGDSVNTFGPRTSYKEGSTEQRQEQFDKYLQSMDWTTPPPAFMDLLSEDQQKQVKNRTKEVQANVVFNAGAAEPDRKKHKSDKSYQESLKQREKALANFQDMTQGMSYEEVLKLLDWHYAFEAGDNGEPQLDYAGNPYVKRSSQSGRAERVKRLKTLYDPHKNSNPFDNVTYYGVEQRAPTPGEDAYFQQHSDVAGMAADDDRIVLNPYSTNTPEQQESVAKNEAIRIWIDRNKPDLTFQVTTQQRRIFQGTEYEKPENERELRATIIARYLTGDDSAGDVTEEQKAVARRIQQQLDAINK